MKMKRPNCQHLDIETQRLIAKYCQGNGIDVGCGYQKIGACVGIDLVPWGNPCNVKGNLSQADWAFDVYDLPLKSNTMDFIYASHVLEHLNEPSKAIDEWLRVLKSGGYLVMLIPHRDYCIPPLKRSQGLHTKHGMRPESIPPLINDPFVEIVSFCTLSTKDVFDVVLRES
jgi:SAM-dependent methyltransferase